MEYLREGNLEELNDLEIFRKFVTPNYKPSAEPTIMCVGASGTHEGRMLREYHKGAFGLNGSVKIAACNIFNFPDELAQGQYDFQLNNPLMGDAKMNYVYQMAQAKFERFSPFDMVYIRNPDLVNIENWSFVFQRAIQQIGGEGVVVSLIRENDTLKYNDLLLALADKKLKPVLSQETGMRAKYSLPTPNFSHTIGIFKNNEGREL